MLNLLLVKMIIMFRLYHFQTFRNLAANLAAKEVNSIVSKILKVRIKVI